VVLLLVVAGPVAEVAEEVIEAMAKKQGVEGALVMKTEPLIARIQRVVLVRSIPR
jgi:type III secretion system FlhB-like substrate exporter